MTPLSRVIWESLPILQQVQFPWRVAIVIDLVAATSLSYAANCLRNAARPESLALMVVSAALLMYAAFSGGMTVRSHLEPFLTARAIHDRHENVDMRRDAREYLPSWVEQTRDESLALVGAMDRIRLDSGKGGVQVARWKARDIVLDIDLAEGSGCIIRQYYFPGWEARIDGITPVAVEPSGSTGLLRLELPPGEYRLSIELKPMWPETTGRILSGLGLLLLALRVLSRFVRHRRQRLAATA
jgi:hypothetical protein